MSREQYTFRAHAGAARDMPAALDIAMPQEVVRASALTGRLDFLVHLPHSTRYLFKVLFAEHQVFLLWASGSKEQVVE